MCYYIGILSPFKLNGSVPPLEGIIPDPFSKGRSGLFCSGEGQVSTWAKRAGGQTSTRMGKNIFGKLGSSP